MCGIVGVLSRSSTRPVPDEGVVLAAIDRVESVELRSLGGKTVRLAARYIVLAAGGIENSRLLLLSGLGNDHEQVGRYFMEHPNYDSGEVVLFSRDDYLSEAYRDIGQEELRFDFQLLPQVQERLGLLNHSAFLVPASKTQSRLARAWARVRGQWNDVDQRTFALRIRLEHAPDPESRVTLSDETDALGQPRARLDMRFGSLEGRTILAVNEAFARALGMTGLGRMKVDFDLVGDWPNRVGWQYHHYGGTRMHDDQKKGVVDRDCRVHGTANLYVAGSSVFPTCGHSNPTMNLIALSLRLAAHLKDKAAP